MDLGGLLYFGLFAVIVVFLIVKRVQEYLNNKKDKK